MKVTNFRLVGIRSFDDTNEIPLSPTCTLFVGQNNAGKSTLLKGLLSLQGFSFDAGDIRPGSMLSYHSATTEPIPQDRPMVTRPGVTGLTPYFFRPLKNTPPQFPPNVALTEFGSQVFPNNRPTHFIVPFIARRKASVYNEAVHSPALASIDGTFVNLYARIDELATAGHPRHEMFKSALADIVGVQITTRSSGGGKMAGFYVDDDTFVPLDRMGDGISEMVGLIVDLCTQREKLFVIEEPETNLHPKGLKALLAMVRASWDRNQFVMATHSNIVVRELGFDERTSVFRVARTSAEPNSPSLVEEVPRDPIAHADLLRELGYEFGDVGLHDGWLFLEESSAEQVISDILIPMFAAELRGRIRTFSAAGVDNLEPTVAEFQRLITFVHLQPAYHGRFWVRADGDGAGERVVANIKQKFQSFSGEQCGCFAKPQFENYYPLRFRDRAESVLEISDRRARRREKATLLTDVLTWSREHPEEARSAWAETAEEIISLLSLLRSRLSG